jgi:hypothetical protein
VTLGIGSPYGAGEPRPRNPWGAFGAGYAAGFASAVVLVALVAGLEGPELSARIAAPAQVRAGERFELVLHVHNPHAEAVEIDNVDVDVASQALLEITLVAPGIGSEDFLGSRTWWLNRSVAPGAATQLSFEAVAHAAGDHQIELNVCNAAADCTSARASLVALPSER